MERWIVWLGAPVVMIVLAATAEKGSGMYYLMGVLLLSWIGFTVVALGFTVVRWLIRTLSKDWHSQAPRNN